MGFTLIELMIVVLIIAILLAIAIPAFLGARGRAQARGAQSNLRNALTTEKTIFPDASSYSADVTAGGVLFTAEPAIKWVAGSTTAQAVGQVGVGVTALNGTSDNVVLRALDPSGTKCWYIVDESTAGATAPGTYYGFTTSTAGVNCPAMTPATGPLASPTAAATASGTWGTKW